MRDKNLNMCTIFNKLSEENKDLMILLAKSIKFTQENSNKNNCDSKKAIQPSA